MINAECHTDDYAVQIDFDALAWFTQASPEEICKLHRCGWGGDYPADDVAIFFADTVTVDLFTYIRISQRGRNPVGFECHVDEDNARKWIEDNRSDVAAMLNAIDDEY